MDEDRPLFFHVMAYAARADRDVVGMVSGNPDWEPPAALRAGLREYADAPVDELQYPPSEGLRPLREHVAERHGVDPARVVITNGGGEANYLAMAESLEESAGETVLLTDPVYPYYPGKTRMLGGTVRYVAADETGGLDPNDVAERIDDEVATVVVNTPNNPTGAVYDEATMRGLAELAADHGARLISDEVYDAFDYSGRFTSALDVDDRTIVTGSFSKSMAITGFRVGYSVLPPELVEAAKTRHMLVNVAGSRPSQRAVLAALEATDDDYDAANRALMADRVETFTAALDEAGADYCTPQGGFYVLARFEGFPGTLENVERLIDEAGVAGMPGEAFGDSRREWLRFALVTPRVEEAADRLAGYLG